MVRSTDVVIVLGALLLTMAGCQRALEPVFPTVDATLAWPRPPDVPRIRYVGELTGQASLKARKSAWTGIGELFVGPTPQISFNSPVSVAARGERVFVADSQARAVYGLNLSARTILTIDRAGGEPFGWPIDVAASPEILAVSDSRRAAVFLFDLDGRYRTALGEGRLKRPSAVAWDGRDKRWWVLDAAAHACLVFERDGRYVATHGRRGIEGGEFNFPAGLCLTSRGDVIVADSMNFRVQRLDRTGSPRAVFGRKGDAAGDFSMPRDVAVDSDGHLYVLDNQFENVQVFDSAGRLLMTFGEPGAGPGEFDLPAGISIDERDRIWIADTYNRRVQVFQYLREQSDEPRS